MNTTAYLNRINYHGPLTPTAETLRELQIAHLLTVPFENLSIHWKQPIVLDNDSLFQKIVVRRRGGFCYELNGLFASLLRSLGFKVEMLSAGVASPDGDFGAEFAHMTLMVTLKERWLADVGFGDSFLEPLLLDNREVQSQGERAYMIVPDGTHLILQQREGDGDWTSQYRFSLQSYKYPDFAEMCRYQETSPLSHFTQARVCSRATTGGRITLSEMRFITTEGPDRNERILCSNEEYKSVLRERFGIETEVSGIS